MSMNKYVLDRSTFDNSMLATYLHVHHITMLALNLFGWRHQLLIILYFSFLSIIAKKKGINDLDMPRVMYVMKKLPVHTELHDECR